MNHWRAMMAGLAGAVATCMPLCAQEASPSMAADVGRLRVAVQTCWNARALGPAALGAKVMIAVAMHPDGRPDVASIRLASVLRGKDAAAQALYASGRRAIIRCGAAGFPLSAEKYEQWKNIEMVFDPENMRIK